MPLQLKLELRGTDPLVWRQVSLPNGATLADLHNVIQIVFGWDDIHLHEFSISSIVYSIPNEEDDDWDDSVEDGRGVPVASVARAGDRFSYVYDFGDDWQLDLVVEDGVTDEADLDVSICIDGEGTNPPEDCGGVRGYQALRASGAMEAAPFSAAAAADALRRRRP